MVGGLRRPARESAPERPPDPAVLTIISGQDQSRGGQRRRLLDEWNERNPQLRARIVEVGGVADAYRSEMVARAQSGERAIDIYNLDVTWVAEFAEAGYIRPLPARNDGFLARPWQTCQYRGEVWALPFNTDAGLLYYRSDLLPSHLQPGDSAPLSWERLAQGTALLLDGPDSPTGVPAGYATQLADYEGLTVNAHEMIWAHDGVVMGNDDWRQPRLDVDSAQVATAVCELARVYAPEDPVILPESVTFDETATTRAFREGKVLFMRNWPVAYRTLEPDPEAEGDGEPAAALEFEVAPLPGPSVLGGQNLAIAHDSARPDEAQELIEFLTNQDSQQQLFLDGGLAATRGAVYDDPAIRTRYPYAALLRDAVEQAQLRPVTPYYARFGEVFRQGVRAAMAGDCQLPADFPDQLRAAMQGLRP